MEKNNKKHTFGKFDDGKKGTHTKNLLEIRDWVIIKDVVKSFKREKFVHLTLEQHGFELHRSTYSWIFLFDKYML